MLGSRPSAGAARALIEAWYRAGLRAVDPREAVQRAIGWDGRRLEVASWPFQPADGARIVAVAIGKAASDMAAGLTDVLGERITTGIILTKDDHAAHPPERWTVFEASHPVPDERGVAATREIIDALGELGPGDLAIVLVSGGGSALLEAPRPPLVLQDIQETTRLLLNAGAPIQDLNAVRSELSQVKGGGLRRTIGEATCISLILSDVLGNDPTVIASGPTIVRGSDPEMARKILARYGVADRVPEAVRTMLRQSGELSAAPASTDDRFVVIGDNDIFIDAVGAAVTQGDISHKLALRGAEGEARNLASTFLDLAEAQPAGVDVVIGGGEATVTVRGSGTGGRNTEFALAAAIALDERQLDWSVASLASDGQDGTIDAAGAVVDRFTVEHGRAMGLDARAALDNNDSGEYFRRLGLLVEPGPTGTNVNDVYLAVRTGPG